MSGSNPAELQTRAEVKAQAMPSARLVDETLDLTLKLVFLMLQALPVVLDGIVSSTRKGLSYGRPSVTNLLVPNGNDSILQIHDHDLLDLALVAAVKAEQLSLN